MSTWNTGVFYIIKTLQGIFSKDMHPCSNLVGGFMTIINSIQIQDQIISELRKLSPCRLTLIASFSSMSNDILINIFLARLSLNRELTRYFPEFQGRTEDLIKICSDKKNKENIEIFAINDIQNLLPSTNEDALDHLSHTTWSFKKLSKDLNCHVILAITIISKDTDKALLTFSRLREVGKLESDPDVILFINNDSAHTVNIVKNRGGEITNFPLQNETF